MALLDKRQAENIITTTVPAHERQRRNTAKQKAVLKALATCDRFRSAQQLYVELRQSYSIQVGLTSIYRILHTLADENVAETQRTENGETLYRARNTTAHHHYLLCRQCGRAVVFTVPALEQHAVDFAHQHHYADVTHHLDLYGICPQCHAQA